MLYTSPNASGGGAFHVTTPVGNEVARWEEKPAPSHFDTSTWHGSPALLFYLRRDELVIRSPRGELLTTLAAPSGVGFQRVHVGHAAGDCLVLVASGNGYTPYHMVCMYERAGQLVFQEIGREHAFELEAARDGPAFLVSTRSRKWRYTYTTSQSVR